MDQQSTSAEATTTVYYEYFLEDVVVVHKHEKNKFHPENDGATKILLPTDLHALQSGPVQHVISEHPIEIQYLSPAAHQEQHLLHHEHQLHHQGQQLPNSPITGDPPNADHKISNETVSITAAPPKSVRKRQQQRRRHDEPQMSCSICNQVLKNKKGLKLHMQIHEGVKRFLCQVCPKTFIRSNHLKSHMKVHTGERPYTCEVTAFFRIFFFLFDLTCVFRRFARKHLHNRPIIVHISESIRANIRLLVLFAINVTSRSRHWTNTIGNMSASIGIDVIVAKNINDQII